MDTWHLIDWLLDCCCYVVRGYYLQPLTAATQAASVSWHLIFCLAQSQSQCQSQAPVPNESFSPPPPFAASSGLLGVISSTGPTTTLSFVARLQEL